MEEKTQIDGFAPEIVGPSNFGIDGNQIIAPLILHGMAGIIDERGAATLQPFGEYWQALQNLIPPCIFQIENRKSTLAQHIGDLARTADAILNRG